MSYIPIEFTNDTKLPEFEQYVGRLALTLGWQRAWHQPQDERYVIITPVSVKRDYPNYSAWIGGHADHNTIQFYTGNYNYLYFRTDEPGYVFLTEIRPVKRPPARKNRWGERPVYTWSHGKWIVDHYEKIEED